MNQPKSSTIIIIDESHNFIRNIFTNLEAGSGRLLNIYKDLVERKKNRIIYGYYVYPGLLLLTSHLSYQFYLIYFAQTYSHLVKIYLMITLLRVLIYQF